jgi:N-acetylgalactosamine-6-sulfatase
MLCKATVFGLLIADLTFRSFFKKVHAMESSTFLNRSLWLLSGFVFMLFTVVPLSADSAPATGKPNIVFIFADDWGWGDLSLRNHEYIKTPNLDRLAQQGIDFHQFTVSNPVCSPSRTAVMTGHFPARHGVHGHFAALDQNAKRNMPDWLDNSLVLLPRLLQRAGYTTAHFGKWHLTNVSATDAPLPETYGYDESAVFNGPGPQASPANSDVDDMAVDFINRHKDKPFFINLWLHEAHTAHFPKDRYLKQYEHLVEPHQIYAAVIAEGDARVGRIMDVLEKNGLTENTLIVFSSDNGPERTRPDVFTKEDRFMQDSSYGPKTLEGYNNYASVGSAGGLRARKRSLYEGGVRVPFIVRWPAKTPAGKINNTTVISAVDLLPTFCDVAGIELPENYAPDGESICRALTGEEMPRTKPIFWNWTGPAKGDWWPRWGVRVGDWKLLIDNEGTRRELYNIPEDPAEANNVIQEHPELAEKLQQQILDWKKTLPVSPPENCISSLRPKQ